MRLKELILGYRLNYSSSSYTILWHTALIYVANELMKDTGDEDWYHTLLLCLYGYQRLSRSWRVARAVSKGLLSMFLLKSNMQSSTAYHILQDLEAGSPDRFPGEVRATFMLDLDRARSEPSSATVEHLAAQFEENAILKDYTTLFDKN